MISIYDSYNTIELSDHYIILQNLNYLKNYKKYRLLDENFSYRSDLNKIFLSKEDLRRIIKNCK
jgi:hypothetical protein